jgi:crossover junction endodeoxyribonuclease RuvC
MISIGIDLSLTGTGVVVIRDGKLVKQELIKSKPAGKKNIDELNRIKNIVTKIEDIVSIYSPDIAVIENLAFGIVKTTSLTQLAGLNYFTRAMLTDAEIPFVLVAPTTLKKFATGKGNCPKDNIMMEIYKRWHVTMTNNNVADAYILAKIGQYLIDDEVKLLTIPQAQVINLLKPQI